MPAKEVYLLQQVLDDPRFEGFAFASRQRSLIGNRLLEDDFTPTDWDVTELLPLWKAPKVAGRVRKYNDFPCVDLTIPAFSDRAVEALGEFLTSAGELLPLDSDVGRYFAFHIRTVIDALDVSRSDIVWFSSTPKRVLDINRFEFHPEALERSSVFTIPETPNRIFVTDEFIKRVDDSRLRGFDCPKLWPLPNGAHYMKQHKQSKNRKSNQPANSATATQNSLLIVLNLGKSVVSSSDQKALDKLLDDLDKILVDKESEDLPVGNVEGHDVVNGNIEVWLSCPDVDRLLTYLGNWFQRAPWKSGLKVFKRYGRYDDVEARQDEVHLPNSG